VQPSPRAAPSPPHAPGLHCTRRAAALDEHGIQKATAPEAASSVINHTGVCMVMLARRADASVQRGRHLGGKNHGAGGEQSRGLRARCASLRAENAERFWHRGWPRQDDTRRERRAEDGQRQNCCAGAWTCCACMPSSGARKAPNFNAALKCRMVQCGHAVLGAYKRCQKFAPSALTWWENLGQAKICVNCPTGVEMEEIEKVCSELPQSL
jgi:hypothetical protein